MGSKSSSSPTKSADSAGVTNKGMSAKIKSSAILKCSVKTHALENEDDSCKDALLTPRF
jgi:hypothetical protein